MMNLDDFKSTWQANPFSTEEKEMSDIQKMIQKNVTGMMKRLTKLYSHVLTSSLIGAAAFTILFYTISDGFRESPLGAAIGILLMLSVVSLAWRRYRQMTGHDYAANLNHRLQALIAQLRQNLMEEQMLIVGLPLAFIILSRLLNGRNLSNMAQPSSLIGLAIMGVFVIGLLVVVRRYYRRDIAELQDLVAQLEAE